MVVAEGQRSGILSGDNILLLSLENVQESGAVREENKEIKSSAKASAGHL